MTMAAITKTTTSTSTTKKETLLNKIGGQDALRAAVDEFYERLMNDDTLQPFLVGVNLQLLKWHQYNFMSIAFTEIPQDLDVGLLISTKHERLFAMGLDETHFDLVAQHFVATLQHLNVPADLIDEAASIVVPLRPIFQQGAILATNEKINKKTKKKTVDSSYFTTGTMVAAVIAAAAAAAGVLTIVATS